MSYDPDKSLDLMLQDYGRGAINMWLRATPAQSRTVPLGDVSYALERIIYDEVRIAKSSGAAQMSADEVDTVQRRFLDKIITTLQDLHYGVAVAA